ncbi:MAG: hypothetical protein LBS74_07820 [Oscillospiraceae bacterium]|jgi:drug/metabolite transporter (DMT)-like permease|nr:hypothetical protein [Oscillospiraceae bacterium]
MVVGVMLGFALTRIVYILSTKQIQNKIKMTLGAALVMAAVYGLFQLVYLFMLPPYVPLEITWGKCLYPALAAVCNTAFIVLYLLALGCGSSSVTNIISYYSMSVPIIAGTFLWGETIGWLSMIGLVLTMASLLLFHQKDYSEGTVKKKVSASWVFLAVGSSLAQGIAGIFAREFVATYPGYQKTYLVLGSLFIFLIPLPYIAWNLLKKTVAQEQPNIMLVLKQSLKACGIGSRKAVLKLVGLISATTISFDLGNMVFIFFVDQYDSALFYPLMSIAGIIAAIGVGFFAFKEKIPKKAYWGMAVSIVAVCILSI